MVKIGQDGAKLCQHLKRYGRRDGSQTDPLDPLDLTSGGLNKDDIKIITAKDLQRKNGSSFIAFVRAQWVEFPYVHCYASEQ